MKLFQLLYLPVILAWIICPALLDAEDDLAELYAKRPSIHLVRISPDGRFISVVNDRVKTVHMLIQDLEGSEHREIKIDEKNQLAGYSWAGSSRRILYAQNYQNFHNRELMTYDLYERKFKTLTMPNVDLRQKKNWRDYYIENIWESNPEKVILQIRNKGFREIYHYDLSSFNNSIFIERFEDSATQVMYPEADAIPRVYIYSSRANYSFFNNADKLREEALSHRADKSDKWKLIEAFNADYSDPSRFYDNPIPIDLSYDGAMLYYAKVTESGTLSIRAYDFERMEDAGAVIESDKFDCYNLSGYSLSPFISNPLVFSHKKQTLVGMRFEGIYPKTIWIDADFKSIQELADQALPDRINQIQDWDHEEQRFILYSYGSNIPAEYFLLDLTAQKVTTLGKAYQWQNNGNIAHQKLIEIPVRDGRIITGILHAPANVPLKELNLLVQFPSSAGDSFSISRDSMNDYYTRLGYAVLSLNPAGSTGFGRNHFEKGYERHGETLLDDIEDAVRFMSDSGISNNSGVGVIGDYWGAYFALRSLQRNPELYRVAIFDSPMVDISTYLRETNRSRMKYERWNFFEMIAYDVDRMKPDFSAISAIHNLERVDVPILIIGSKGGLSSLGAEASELHSALRKLKKNSTLIEATNQYSDWGVERLKGRVTVMNAKSEFLKKYFQINPVGE